MYRMKRWIVMYTRPPAAFVHMQSNAKLVNGYDYDNTHMYIGIVNTSSTDTQEGCAIIRVLLFFFFFFVCLSSVRLKETATTTKYALLFFFFSF